MSIPTRVRTSRPRAWTKLKPRARAMRRGSTRAEGELWEHLRDKALGVRFRRQHAIGEFVVDFVALKANLIVEVDGGIHQTPHQRGVDAIREAHLKGIGYTIVRFSNEQVLTDIDSVLSAIRAILP